MTRRARRRLLMRLITWLGTALFLALLFEHGFTARLIVPAVAVGAARYYLSSTRRNQ